MSYTAPHTYIAWSIHSTAIVIAATRKQTLRLEAALPFIHHRTSSPQHITAVLSPPPAIAIVPAYNSTAAYTSAGVYTSNDVASTRNMRASPLHAPVSFPVHSSFDVCGWKTCYDLSWPSCNNRECTGWVIGGLTVCLQTSIIILAVIVEFNEVQAAYKIVNEVRVCHSVECVCLSYSSFTDMILPSSSYRFLVLFLLFLNHDFVVCILYSCLEYSWLLDTL